MKGQLILSDGSKYNGYLFGSSKMGNGEVVFQTGMVGYIESLSDPSYKSQLLVLTYPIIGSYGVPDESEIDKLGLPKFFESCKIHATGLIVNEYSTEYSNWAAKGSLEKWLEVNNVVGISGIDTRNLTKKLREKGSMTGIIVPLDGNDMPNINKNPELFIDPNMENLVEQVSSIEKRLFNESGSVNICVIDCGIKYNQIRCLAKYGAKVTVFPWDYVINPLDFDAMFISNGPGDPTHCYKTVDNIKTWLKSQKPLMGICLGHQLLSLAIGCKTYKMKYGNRGHNQPCTHLPTERCFMTSQNHGFAVDTSSIPNNWRELFYNANDGTNEGIVHTSLPFFSVQFHPEHMSGPKDTEFLFEIFIQHIHSIAKSRESSISLDQRITNELTYKPNANELRLIEITKNKLQKVLILGSGGLSIGQAGEFDYSGSQALKALREEGIQTVLINPNIATVQTSMGMADKSYLLPITKDYVTEVIKMERPDGVYLTFGGQTALNCGIELEESGIFKEYNVSVLGTSIETIKWTEDRQIFADKLAEINISVAPSMSAYSIQECIIGANTIGYPVMLRAAFALGGLGSGFANNENELIELATISFAHTVQVFLDKALRGWKEIEYEVVRDMYDNCITVCNMENVDPLGIHTGESVVVAPSQTLSNYEYNMLRTCALKVVRHLGVVGECNIQYALDPESHQYYIIEVNARLSRSSALASKATGYPLAYVAAKLGIGKSLLKLKNSVTTVTTACFEPSMDYCVVKFPRWDLNKFTKVCNIISSSMKSVGEVMAIGRTFEEAFQKALRMVDEKVKGFDPYVEEFSENGLSVPTDRRMLVLANALKIGVLVKDIYELTKIDKWFLYKFAKIINCLNTLEKVGNSLSKDMLHKAKLLGFSDKQIAGAVKSTEIGIRKKRIEYGIMPYVRQIDTVSAEWPCETNYLYLTYSGIDHDITFPGGFIMVLGSGVYRIGSSVEFDCCAVECINELRKMNKKTIMVNCNPETVSTDYDMCDHLFFEEISLESVMDIYQIEKPDGVIVSMGGQLPNNIAMGLHRENVIILGTSATCIDGAENRFKFSRMLDSIGILQPKWRELTDEDSAKDFCTDVKYPVLVRPSYVLSGAAMNVAFSEFELMDYLNQAVAVNKDHPVVISKFIEDAKEIDVDAVAFDGKLLRWAVSEHVENAGVHSGDATLVTPPQDMNEATLSKIGEICKIIAKKLDVSGPFNMQLIAKDNNLQVIECNLRVSRSFPFVSKSLGFNMIAAATRAIMSQPLSMDCEFLSGITNRVAVKAPVFSFSRLRGADVLLGVEMASTGEVACFGEDRHEAFLKAQLAQGMKFPKTGENIYLSIGSYKHKKELLDSVRTLAYLGYELLASIGTADYYNELGFNIKPIDWGNSNGDSGDQNDSKIDALSDYICENKLQLIINLPKRNSGLRRGSCMTTNGYKNRLLAVEYGVPLFTNIKCTKMFVSAIKNAIMRSRIIVASPTTDCITSQKIYRFPDLIDIHVHTRDPGQVYKEDWGTVSRAAISGGITTILAMPNTKPAVTNAETLNLVKIRAAAQSYCNYGIYLGASVDNAKSLIDIGLESVGLKMYLNPTFNSLHLPNYSDWVNHFDNFPENRPICCHAEGETIASVMFLAYFYHRSVHICHVSRKYEIEMIKKAKGDGVKVTCEVAPHHMFLTETCLNKGVKDVKPPLAHEEDVEAMWNNLDVIDCFASDHAPHTMEEKISQKPPPGFPGLETMLPLLLDAHSKGRITLEQITEKLSTNPRKIFNLPPPETNTWVEVDLNEKWSIGETIKYETKANWSPFHGREVCGRVKRVMLNGNLVFIDGKFLTSPGVGRNVVSKMSSKVLSGNKRNRLSSSISCKLENDLVDQHTYLAEIVTEKDLNMGMLPNSKLISSSSSKKIEISKTFNKEITGHHFLSVNDLDKAKVNTILNLAHDLHIMTERNYRLDYICRGKVLALMFYEASTRTSCSFEAAMERLGGSVIHFNECTSSVLKGESLEDTVRMMSSYSNCLVVRHPKMHAMEDVVKVSAKPVINAGDGSGEHPSQALLDVFTIREEFGTVNNLIITMVGDLANGRTVHSLARLLCLYNIKLQYVPYCKEMRMPKSIVDYVSSRGIHQEEFANLEEALSVSDVVYMTRVQKERLTSLDNWNQECLKRNTITPQLMSIAKKKMIVMHPLPRLDEISTAFDSDPRAAYFRQAEYGLYVRMALLAVIMSHM